MRKLTAIGLVSAWVCTGCASVLTMNYYSTPPGAAVYEGQRLLGYAPLSVNYTPTPQFKAGGCMQLNAVSAQWSSGVSTSAVPIQACGSTGYYQQWYFQRPEAPGIESDLAQARAIEAARYAAEAQAHAQAQQNAAQLGYLAGCALAGGCGPAPTQQPARTYSAPPPSAPTQIAPFTRPSLSTTTATPKPAIYSQPTAPAAHVASQCTLDIHCGFGKVCARSGYGQGECVVPVNQYGRQIYSGPKELIACRWSTDCPTAFECRKQAGHLDGYCAKQ